MTVDLIRHYPILNKFNLFLKHLKLSDFLTKLSYEELRNRKLSIKPDLILMVKLIKCSNPFSKTIILRLNLPSSCITR